MNIHLVLSATNPPRYPTRRLRLPPWHRSALEWVPLKKPDQYRVSTDPRSGITNDPNREDDERYILRLIGQVIAVSLETQKIIATLPALNLSV